MFKNLDGDCFGIAGRQNEVIEFALSNGYTSISVNFSDLVTRAGASGVEFSARYLISAKKLVVGQGELNIRLAGTDEEFTADVESLATVLEIVDSIRNVEGGVDHRADRVTVNIQPYSDTLAYDDNFEVHKSRISQIAAKLAEKNLQIGLGIQAATSKRAEKENEFIWNAEGLLKLVSAINLDNVGINLNTWDWLVGGGTIEQLGSVSIDKIVCVTLTDMPENADLANLQNSERLLPGTGDTSFNTSVCQWLHDNGYNGPVSPGPSPLQFTGSSRDAVIHKAANAIDAILVKIGAIEPATPDVVEVAPSEDEAAEAETPTDDAKTSEESPAEEATS
ncbi:MAG: TIM barrel protein [Planctomycetota bacterium]|nr:TIM barrel protein [Planctomycetota bacterium]